MPAQSSASEACAEYFGCLHYGTLTEAQARTSRGHPEFVEVQSETAAHTGNLTAARERTAQASRIATPSDQQSLLADFPIK